jgi:hypothetical protein
MTHWPTCTIHKVAVAIANSKVVKR